MALSADQLHLFAVNTQNSTVVDFTDSSGIPTSVFRVPKSPVSIGVWDDEMTPSDPEKLVVVCDGTYALVVLDRSSGKVLRLVELRDPVTARIMGEPGDLLIDDGTVNMAFVSCAAADAVLQVDLVAGTVVSKFDLPGKDPVFLCFDGTPNKNVLVAPMFSGNNSGARQFADSVDFFNAQHQGPTVVDFATQGIPPPPPPSAPPTRLPDHDLFRCLRATPPLPAGAVEPVTTGVGTVLFACGINVTSGKIWQLNTEANNKDPLKQTEASIKGNIVQNRLSIVADPGVGQPPAAPAAGGIHDLDLTNPLLPYDPTRTVGQPYGLSFAGGIGLVTGLLTDNVMVLGTSANFLGEFDLPDGSLPRATLYSSLFGYVYVYCWGTSKIEVHRLSDLVHVNTLDLGYDPTPAPVKEGRRIFYDAAHSEHNNASCASCHVEGRTDMVVWNLAKGTLDDKGPMVTQTLAGIEKYVPFHWRGEQQLGLIDFNPAFVNLLGAPDPDGPSGPLDGQLSASDFDLFQRFVFSIQDRPNPFENEERKVDDAIEPPQLVFPPHSPLDANATTGQTLFASSCETCHNFPIGTSNDIVGDGALKGEQNPRRQFFKIAPFHDLYKKEQDADKTVSGVQLVTIWLHGLNGGPDEASTYPPLGTGLAHTGLIADLNQFVAGFQGLTDQDIADITGFIFQWDQGVAPATYRAFLLEAGNASVVSTFITNQVNPTAPNSPNCDLAVFGTSVIGGTPTPMRWYYDRGLSPPFVAELTGVARRNFTDFPADGSNVFVGLPVGSGRRFAIDFDEDEFLNGDEIAAGTDPQDPSSHPAFTDNTFPTVQARVEMVTSRVARVNIVASEPCVATVTYTPSGGTPQTKTTTEFVRTQSVTLNDLLRASSYAVDVSVQDRAGHTTFASPSLALTTRPGNGTTNIAVIGSLTWGSITKGVSPGGFKTLQAVANVHVDQKNGGPPPIPIQNVRVIARVFVDGVLNNTFTAFGSSKRVDDFDFPAAGTDFTGLAGPFLFSALTTSTGDSTLKFNLAGLPLGARVTLNVELVAPQTSPPLPNPPGFVTSSISDWSMPATPAIYRSLSVIM